MTSGLLCKRNDTDPAHRFVIAVGVPVHGDQIMPSDDLDSIAERLVSITDNGGRKVKYAIRIDGTLARATAMIPNGSQWSELAQTTYWYDEYYTSTTLEPNANYRATRNWLVEMETVWAEEVEDQPDKWRKVSFSYTYEDAGNRLSRTASELEIVAGNWEVVGNPRTETYAYDDLYRLTGVNYGDGQTQTYTFDPMGNRLSKTDSVSGNETYAYNKANMLTARNSQTYVNDDNGNTISGGGRANTWDTQNRLRQTVYNGVTTAFTYGADGLRRSMKVGSDPAVHYLLNGQSVAQEGHLDGGSFVADVTYFSGIRGPEFRYDHDTQKTIWYIYDGLGSVVGELEAKGVTSDGYAYAEVTATRKFDVYGLPKGGTGESSTNHGFVGSLGHTSESSTGGLIYMRARWMDPSLGRFISEDPAKDGANWFTYCRNNPVNLTDKTGKFTIGEVEYATGEAAGLSAGAGGVAGGAHSGLVGMIYRIIANKTTQAIAGIVGQEHVSAGTYRSGSQYYWTIHGEYQFRLCLGHGGKQPHWNVDFLRGSGHQIALELVDDFLAIVDLVHSNVRR